MYKNPHLKSKKTSKASHSEYLGSLRCFYTNATSLNSDKILELSTYTAKEDPHCIFITETWFTDISVPQLDNYVLFRHDRNGHGGGVAIYTRKDLYTSEINEEKLKKKISCKYSEQVWLTIDAGFEEIIIGCIYRPPCNDPKKLQQIDKEINKNIKAVKSFINKKKYGGLLLTGDFNFPYVRWLDDGSPQVLGSDTSPGSIFIDLLDDESLTQNVHIPTFKQADDTLKNTLDYIISDTPDRVQELLCHGPLGTTKQGHLCITWNFQLSKPLKKNKTSSVKFLLNRGQYDEMNNTFTELNWTDLFQNKSADKCYTIFQNKYNEICDKFIPKKTKSNTKQRAPWMNKDLMRTVKKKKTLWHQNMSTNWKCTRLANEYEKINRDIKKLTRTTVRDFEEQLANDKKNPKKLYAYINSRQKVKTQINSLRVNNKTVTEGKEIANALNDQFQSVFVDDSDNTELPEFKKRTNELISDISFGPEKVCEYLKKMKTDKSQGNDNIQKCAKSLAKPISIIFQRSFDQSELPQSWLEANVTPLFKKGSRSEPANYRPISLTSVICKLMEKIIKDEVMQYLNKHKLINKQQHGFVYNKACNTNLLETMDTLTKLLADKESFDMLLLDFAKAFDKVAHKRLNLKLSGYGICGKLLAWLKAFLTGRKQRVILGEFVSEWVKVNSSVIQGSVLGPLLFILFINDLVDYIINKAKLFADDTKILAKTNNSIESSLQKDIDSVLEWTSTWLMRLNLDKCKIMHFGKNNPKINYTMKSYDSEEQIQIEKTESERDLGIQVQANLKYDAQVSKSASKAKSMLGMLKRTIVTRNIGIWKKLYTTYVRPHLEFAISAWNPYLKKDIETLEKVQRRATKISPTIKNLSYENRLEKLKLTTLEKRRTRGDLIQHFKIVNKLDIIEWENPPSTAPPRSGRRSQYKRELVKNCAQRFNFFNNRIACEWNGLPDKIVTAKSINQFKALLDEHTKSCHRVSSTVDTLRGI